MSVIKSNMAAIAIYYTNVYAWLPPNFMIAIHVFGFKMHSFEIFQKLNRAKLILI